MGWIGATLVQRRVERGREGEQPAQRDRQHHQRIGRRIGEYSACHREKRQRRNPASEFGGAAIGGEGNAEAEQIEAEREHPQQRHGDDVGG